MKQLNNNPINHIPPNTGALHPWTTFCVFSTTESHISKFFNVTTSLFFTREFNLILNEDLCTRLYSNNFRYIFDINENYHETIIYNIDVGDNNSLIIFRGNLQALLVNEELFKNIIVRKLINSSVFILNNIKWKDFCKEFLKKDIVLSGGSSTRRHMLSPIHIRLVIVLTAFKFNYKDIVRSFNVISKEKELSLPKDNLTSPLPTGVVLLFLPKEG